MHANSEDLCAEAGGRLKSLLEEATAVAHGDPSLALSILDRRADMDIRLWAELCDDDMARSGHALVRVIERTVQAWQDGDHERAAHILEAESFPAIRLWERHQPRPASEGRTPVNRLASLEASLDASRRRGEPAA